MDSEREIEKRKKWLFAAAAILVLGIGIFLRTYQFRDWLYFYPDQARDVKIVGDYLDGKISLPLIGFRAASTNFELGAMYYYFQIASGKLFGVRPDTMAFPDLFFNILAISLLYFFLKRYFKSGISLALTAMYAVSYYAIEFSRFAWNPNSMPFFVLLYLTALLEFLEKKEKTHWGWIAGIGVSVGIGIQLHTIFIFLLLGVSSVTMIISLWKNWRIWNRWLAIIGIVLLLNTNQIISETTGHRTNFSNTKKLINLSLGSSGEQVGGGKLNNLMLDAVCHAQANVHIISSLGNKINCDYISTEEPEEGHTQKIFGYYIDPNQSSWIISGLIFSLLGYGLLIYSFLTETDRKKKIFLGLVCLYALFTFMIVFPIIGETYLRYFLPVFFMPYIFVGLLLEFVRRRLPQLFLPTIVASLALVAWFNFSTIDAEAKLYASKNHSQPQYVVLGELEQMRDYIISQTNSAPTVYLVADGKYMQNYFYPLQYVLGEKKIILTRELEDFDNTPSDATAVSLDDYRYGRKSVKGFSVIQSREFGKIGVYVLGSRNISQP
jgi:4-amino-4-deoxy-L-arabinose transferase-like glycosyltransferase